MNDPRALLPQLRTVPWWPLLFSVFALIIPLESLRNGGTPLHLGVSVATSLVVIALFACVIYAQHQGRTTLWALIGLSALAVALAPTHGSSSVLWAYAASFAPYAAKGRAKETAMLLTGMCAGVALEAWLIDLRPQTWLLSLLYIVVLGSTQVWAARQAFSTTRQATLSERERISRDLHDVMGHTLSVISLKAELAARLVEKDPARAKHEIAEVARISREALAEARDTIRGYRESSLQQEIVKARNALETAGVAVECDISNVATTPEQENVLSLALREAVTNVVRHAQARTCRVLLHQTSAEYRLEIQDDGLGNDQTEGSGLKGMRERVESRGGSVLREARNGTRLTVTLPA